MSGGQTSDGPVWRGMNRAELDTAYDNSAAVPEGIKILQGYVDRSAELRRHQPDLLDLPYGPRPRNRIDLFRCGHRQAPLMAFVHGGYWQRNAKEMFSCLAEGPMAHGFDVAMIGYTLAPDASLTELNGEIRNAIRFLRENGPSHEVATGRLVISGWSAGAHLASLHMNMPEVDALFCLSGLFDVEPIQRGRLNALLNLTDEEVQTLSPIRNIPDQAKPAVLAYGADELPELQRHSRAYAEALKAKGYDVHLLPLDGENHYSILDQLTQADSVLTRALLRLV